MHSHPLNIVEVILLFAIVLGIMVLVHELGHFIVGKLCGVRVETFSIGFGTRLFGVKIGETDYRISALPLGGYVKFAGELPGETTAGKVLDPGDFSAHPRWQRVLIALAGPCANFVLSFFLLLAVGHFHHEVQKYLNGPALVDYVPANTPAAQDGLAIGDTIVTFDGKVNPTWNVIAQETALNLNQTVSMTFNHNGTLVTRDLHIVSKDKTGTPGPEMMIDTGLIAREQEEPLTIASVAGGTPAERAGLHEGDKILRIGAITPHSLDTMHGYLHDRAGAPESLLIERNGQTLPLVLVPEHIDKAPDYADYQIGFTAEPVPVDVEKLSLGEAAKYSVSDNLSNSTLILRVLKGMFTRHVAVSSLSGPVGIAQQVALAYSFGGWALMDLMANISLNLGIFNLLPIPILDGGMILFLLIESIIRRDVNEQVKERVYQVAFVCIVLLACFVTFNDLTRHVHH